MLDAAAEVSAAIAAFGASMILCSLLARGMIRVIHRALRVTRQPRGWREYTALDAVAHSTVPGVVVLVAFGVLTVILGSLA